ncbi:MAG: hypothetical protein R2681_17870 [Pyrinomonadaceae bacterium]
MKYTDEKEIYDLIRKFENGTIRREDWGHPEHLIVAYHYSVNNDYETALSKMRDGIFALLRAFKIDLTKEMPYHESMTVFWMRTVYDFAAGKEGYSVETIDEMIERFDKDHPLKFYTRETLFSEKARAEFVRPDVKDWQKSEN